MRKITILIFIAFITNTCSFEDYDTRTYYDAVGVGYVYYGDTHKPAQNMKVIVWCDFRSNGYATVRPVTEEFFTDSQGCYHVKFLKRTQRENVIQYSIWAGDSLSGKSTANSISLLPEEIKNINIIYLDTLIFNF